MNGSQAPGKPGKAGTRRKLCGRTWKKLETGELGLAWRIFEEFHAFPEVEMAYLQIMGCLVVVVQWLSAGMFVIFVSHQWLGVSWHGKNAAARTDRLFVSFCHHSINFEGYLRSLELIELTT